MSAPDDSDMLAAEYVLGTLDADERAAVGTRLATDPQFERAVAAWAERLAPLADTVPDLIPPAALYDAILTRLFGPMPVTADPQGVVTVGADTLRRRLRRWQAATGGLALLAASLLAWIVVRDALPVAPEASRFTAVLQRDSSAPAMVLDIDLGARRLTVRPLLASAPAGRSYELWIIDPTLGRPRSLGVVGTETGGRGSLTAFDPSVITGATYAVTLEAAGGSTTGQPTAAPILSGKLVPTRS